MTDFSHGAIDWDTAEVSGGVLTVALAGEPSAAWVKRFAAVVERLDQNSQGWDEIKTTKTQLKITGVLPGIELELRHFVEGVLQQANADFAASEQSADGERSEQDAEMTEAFRAFAEGPDE